MRTRNPAHRSRHACRACRVVVAAAIASFAHDARADALPWEIWTSPATLAALDPDDAVIETSSHCLDGCRYDRSNAGPEDPADNPYPERWTYRDGDEAVVFDDRGPGAITRLWLTTGYGTSSCIDPAIRVRFYLDGAAVPALDLPLAALFDGSVAPFTPPLVAGPAETSGGYVSHVPIAYAESLRISLTGADNGGTNPCTGDDRRLLWFQIQHHRLAPGTAIASFDPSDDFPAWRAFLAHAGDDPWNGMLPAQNGSTMLAPGATIDLATRNGPAWLRGIRLQLPRSDYSDVTLRLSLDGEIAVDAPLADFFATAPDATVAARGVLAGEDESGWLYAWLPMPFQTSARVQLVAGDSLAAPVAIASALHFDDAPIPATSGRFSAAITQTCANAGDLALYSASGSGRIVGIAARYRAGVAGAGLGYLEGDERAYVDGAIAPSWYGTGVEDFYDSGFYFDHGAYALALSGATGIDPDGRGTTTVYRWLLTDPLGWSSALRWTQEAGFSPIEPVPTCVRALVYAYRDDRASSVVYDRFEVGTAAAAAHDYAAPDAASCASLASSFEDEPPTPRTANACSYTGGSSRFSFRIEGASPPLRLRRTFDAGSGAPGAIEGSAAAEIRVNGVAAGWFAPSIANPERRWQQQEATLGADAADGVLDIEIVPAFESAAPSFSESEWELRGGWRDAIFVGAFDE